MASPAKVAEVLPDTLPEDFREWDDDEFPSTQPVRLTSSEHGSGLEVVSRQAAQPAETRGAVTALRDFPVGVASPTSDPKFVEHAIFPHRVRSLSPALDAPHEPFAQGPAITQTIEKGRFPALLPLGTAAFVAPIAAPAPQAAAVAESDEMFRQLFRAEIAEPRQAERKRLIFAIASSVLLVVLAVTTILIVSRRTAPPVKQVPASGPSATANQHPESAAPQPTLSTQKAPTPTQIESAGNYEQHGSGATPGSDQENAGPSQAQAQMMNEQLNAPTRIHIAATPAEQAPPPMGGLGPSEMDTSGNINTVGSLFSITKLPSMRTTSSKVVTISSGVKFGSLIRSTPPVYPPAARAARVSGTVVLTATISESGTIKNLRVVSGPALLQQSAVDAVRTWRYKPPKLNNQPTEIETTINVTFSLGN